MSARPLVLALAVLAVLGSPGCAWFAARGETRRAERPVDAGTDDTGQPTPVCDTPGSEDPATGACPTDETGYDRAADEETSPADATSQDEPVPSDNDPAPTPAPSTGAATPAPASDGTPAELQPTLLDQPAETLRRRTERELTAAQTTIDELGARELSEDATEQLTQAVHFVGQAREALTKGDLQRASILARKAAVLLEDLSP